MSTMPKKTDVNMPEKKHPYWIEIAVEIPTSAKDTVIGWFMDRGSSGVQEDYPGLFPLDGSGPVTSGDPREWHGEATPNPGERVLLKGWLPPPMTADEESRRLAAFLYTLNDEWPGIGNSRIESTEIESVDWNAEWKSHWKPIEIAEHFLICPTWEPPPDTSRIVIMLDPGMAFGTGTHFTTASCIEAAEEWFSKQPDPTVVSVLDVGTGSGILAIAALKMGAREALGIDGDPDAAKESVSNAETNCVADRYFASDKPLTGHEGFFELVFANILAGTLKALASEITSSVMPGGYLITSGILQEFENEVVDEFVGRGFVVTSIRRDDTWSTVSFEKQAL